MKEDREMKARSTRRVASLAATLILALLMGTALAPIASAGPITTPGGPVR
jgi:hypothetical protein